jgi:NAD(P)-dependent dehydrogenase (short-subunit alcohol dehydrogenase family)
MRQSSKAAAETVVTVSALFDLSASDASSWITGALIPMDGGNLAMNPSASIPR